MKLLLIGGAIHAQVSLDTIYVRNLQLQARDWLWMVGKYPSTGDSLTQKGLRKLRAVAQTLQPPVAMTTNVNVDSLPGCVVVEMYRIRKTAQSGEQTARYTAITSAIAAKTVLSFWLTAIDNDMTGDEDRAISRGKYLVLDQ